MHPTSTQEAVQRIWCNPVQLMHEALTCPVQIIESLDSTGVDAVLSGSGPYAVVDESALVAVAKGEVPEPTELPYSERDVILYDLGVDATAAGAVFPIPICLDVSAEAAQSMGLGPCGGQAYRAPGST